jgi:hypothetical protein
VNSSVQSIQTGDGMPVRANNGGICNGYGISSSIVAALNVSQSALIYSVGYADGADGITTLPSGQIIIMPTLSADAKMEGNVVFGDFQLLSQYIGDSNTTWDEGNFTYGSEVDFGDFQLLSQDFGGNDSALFSSIGPDPAPPQVVLTIVADDGNYTVYANDTSTNNAGIVSFDVDVVGDGGAEVTSSYNYAPSGVAEIRVGRGGYILAAGFAEWKSNGDDGGDGMEITAMENVAYGSSDNPYYDAAVIQGFGQTSGSEYGMTWVQTSLGVAIATGTYSGSGTLSVNVSSGGYIQTLNIVSDGQWSGPGNMSIAQVTGDTIDVS